MPSIFTIFKQFLKRFLPPSIERVDKENQRLGQQLTFIQTQLNSIREEIKTHMQDNSVANAILTIGKAQERSAAITKQSLENMVDQVEKHLQEQKTLINTTSCTSEKNAEIRDQQTNRSLQKQFKTLE